MYHKNTSLHVSPSPIFLHIHQISPYHIKHFIQPSKLARFDTNCQHVTVMLSAPVRLTFVNRKSRDTRQPEKN